MVATRTFKQHPISDIMYKPCGNFFWHILRMKPLFSCIWNNLSGVGLNKPSKSALRWNCHMPGSRCCSQELRPTHGVRQRICCDAELALNEDEGQLYQSRLTGFRALFQRERKKNPFNNYPLEYLFRRASIWILMFKVYVCGAVRQFYIYRYFFMRLSCF